MIRLASAIAGNTFLEAIRQPIYFVLVLAGCLLQILNLNLAAYSLGFSEEGKEVDADDKLLLDMGLATVFVIATLLAAFIATNVLSREIENKTALTVIAKPVARPVFVLGKYVGAAGAILMATFIMLNAFALALRHEVMSTARDTIDWPVVVFGFGALFIAVGVGIWGNFFYRWVFSSVATLLLAPLLFVAFCLTQIIGKNWELLPPTQALTEWMDQRAGLADILVNLPNMPPPTEWWKPEVFLASIAVMLAMLVLTALAVAVSTRLGQVLTIAVCAVVFMLGLLSNHLLGRHAYDNTPISRIAETELVRSADEDFLDRGDRIALTLERNPDREIPAAVPIYFAPDPAGIAMINAGQSPEYTGDIENPTHIDTPSYGRAILTVSYDRETRVLTLVNAGDAPLDREPRANDYIFFATTEVNPLPLAAWSVIPNLQAFWLIDPITQGHPIPWRYMGMLVLYTAAQVAVLLSLATIFFQNRDVG